MTDHQRLGNKSQNVSRPPINRPYSNFQLEARGAVEVSYRWKLLEGVSSKSFNKQSHGALGVDFVKLDSVEVTSRAATR